MRRTNLLWQSMGICFLAFSHTHQLAGQTATTTYLNATGSPNFSVMVPVPNGYINLANGNLHLEIPIATQKQRGNLQLNERFVYDSRIWEIVQYDHYYWWPLNVANSEAGWRFVKGNETGTLNEFVVQSSSSVCNSQTGAQDVGTTSGMTWTDPSGTAHTFDALLVGDDNECGSGYTQSINAGYASDASGYYVQSDSTGSPIVKDPSGNEVYPQVIDRYGNYWSTDANGNLVDDVGRTPVITTQNGNTVYYDVLAPNGPINNNGTRVRYTVTLEQLTLTTNFNENPVVEYQDNGNPPGSDHPSVTAIQSIQLPDGSSYQFSYDSYGEITSVTLPTGGVIQYGWANYTDSYNNVNRWITSSTIAGNATTYTPSVITQCTSDGTGCQEQVNVHRPSGDEQVYTFTLNNGAWNTATTIYSGAASGGQAKVADSTAYDFSELCVNTQVCGGTQYVTKALETTSLLDASLTTQVQTAYSQPATGQMTLWAQWDYYPSGSTPSSQPTRSIQYAYSGYDLVAETHYDQNANPVAKTIYDYTTDATSTSGVVGHGSANSGGPYLTEVQQATNVQNNSYNYEIFSYDDTGTVQSVLDFNHNPITLDYDPTETFVTEVDQKDTSTAGATYHHIRKSSYDVNSGAVLTTDDQNSVANGQAYSVVYAYEPVAGRLSSITYPAPAGGVTSYSYPSPTEIDTKVQQNASTSITTASIVDSYGRPYQIASGGISEEQTYDVNGRPYGQSAPHLTTGSPTDGTTYTYYDTLNRPTSIQFPDQNAISVNYLGNVVTVKDELGQQTQRTFDAFGDLTDVIEADPATGALDLETKYQIDGLGNIICVEQHGNVSGTGCGAPASSDPSSAWRVRRFSYDALSELRAEEIPEHMNMNGNTAGQQNCNTPDGASTWTDCFYYDANGNKIQSQDNRGVVTTRTYDALNRITSLTTPGSISYAYAYDQNTNGVGHLSSQSSTNTAGSSYTYDVLGRMTAEISCHQGTCPGGCLWTMVQYDQAGNVVQITYPDGRVIQNNYDSLNRLASVVYQQWGTQAVGTTYWSASSYAPPGELQGAQIGAVQMSAGFNNRQSLTSLSYQNSAGPIFSKSFHWDVNAKNLLSETNQLNSQFRQFSYDKLNRLTAAQDYVSAGGAPLSGGLDQQYTLDAWGNLSSMGSSGFSQPINGQNQVETFGYDPAGRLLNDGVTQYTYYDDGLLATSSDGETYTYDAAKQRVKILSNSSQENYYFNGRLMATWNPSTGAWTDLIYADGQKIALVAGTQNATPKFSLSDHIGSEVATVDVNGNVLSSLDYSPWGQIISGTMGSGYFFTGLQRDNSGLDHAMLRQYSSITGRWLVPDSYNGSYVSSNPQSLNRYSYVLNSPLHFTDPSGADGCSQSATTTVTLNSSTGQATATNMVMGPLTCSSGWLGVIAEALVDAVKLLFGGWHQHYDINVSAANNGKFVREGMTNLQVRPFGNTVIQAGGGWGPVAGGVSYVPSTGELYGAPSVGLAYPTGSSWYVGAGTTTELDQSGGFDSGLACFGPCAGVTRTIGTGATTSLFGIGSPGVSWMGGVSLPLPFSLPPAAFNIQVPIIPDADAITVDGVSYEDEAGEWYSTGH